MSYSFNLVDCPWIPCTHLDGRVEALGLREALRNAHQLRGLQGDSPLETAAIYRLLLAVLHSALRGPKSTSEWSGLWKEGKGNWDASWLNDYFDAWRPRFDLFDKDHPFYQIKDSRVKPKSVLDVIHGMGTANELFEHVTVTYDVTLTLAQAARRLLVGQFFGLGGGCDPSQNLYLSSGTWAKGVIFLVEGDNLFQNLALNLLQYNLKLDRPFAGSGSGKDAPAWEMENPYEPNRHVPYGYLDYLTWQNRRLLLIPERGDDGETIVRKMTLAPGLALQGGFLHPMKLYKAGKKGWFQEEFSEERSLWRDSHALFLVGDAGETNTSRPPQTFSWLSNLVIKGYLPNSQILRFMALGMATHRTQAKIFFYREEHLPLPLAYLADEELVSQLTDSLLQAENVRKALWLATNIMAQLLISPTADQKGGRVPDTKDSGNLLSHWNAERAYWQALELPFLALLQDLPGQPAALQTWKDAVRRAAWDALESAAGLAGDDATALKAAVRARARLGSELKTILPENGQPANEAAVS